MKERILSKITAGNPMVWWGTPINLIQGLVRPGLIRDPISPLLSIDLWNGERAGKKGGAARSHLDNRTPAVISLQILPTYVPISDSTVRKADTKATQCIVHVHLDTYISLYWASCSVSFTLSYSHTH